jgi:hypothetical protein
MGEPINYEQRRDMERRTQNERAQEKDPADTILFWFWLQHKNGR